MLRRMRMTWAGRLAGIAAIAGVTALAGGLAGGPASALPPHISQSAPSLVWPVMDEEDRALREDLETGEVPAAPQAEERAAPAPDRAEPSGGNIEDEELKREMEAGD